MAAVTRRSFFVGCSLAAAPAVLRPAAFWGPPQPGAAGAAVHAGFPAHDPAVVVELVTVAHFNAARVKALVERQPAMARAAWDWGFGDWESPLGAASHVGHREIAEYLIARGARPTIFSAAMLGQLEVVKAFVAAAPGIQRTKGPHGIPLMKHAEAGGAPARAVADYLQTVEGANEPPAQVELRATDADRLLGTYAFGTGPTERLTVAKPRDQLTLARSGMPARTLFHLGELTFYPAGAEAVRIRFTVEEIGVTLVVLDPGPIVTAKQRPPGRL